MRIPLGRNDNVATFPMASGYEKFKAFCCEAELDETTWEVITLPSGFVSDDEDEQEPSDEAETIKAWQNPTDSGNKPASHDLDGPSSTPLKGETTKASTETKDPQPAKEPRTADMDLPRMTNVNIILDEEDRQPANDLAELLALHHQFGHISMRKLQEMAKQGGIIPRRLSKCRVPTCSACLYAKARKRPWRNKPKSNEATLAKQAYEKRRRRNQTYKTRSSDIRRPTRLTNARTYCPEDRIPSHEALPLCNCLCRSIQSTGIYLSPKDSVSGGNSGGEESI